MRMKPRTFGIPPEDDERLCALAKQHGMQWGDVLRRFIRFGLKEARKDPAKVLLNQGQERAA